MIVALIAFNLAAQENTGTERVRNANDGAARSLAITGTVVDRIDREPIAAAHLSFAQGERQTHTLSAADGAFRVTLDDTGAIRVHVARYGYEQFEAACRVHADTILNILLSPAPLNLREVIVQSEQPSRTAEMAASAQPVFVMSKRELEDLSANDVGDALAYVPGVFIKDYGGMGGLKTISLRGSPATQTPVLIDGVRYDNHQSGTTDLSTLSLGDFSAIRIYRGGNSASFGAAAMTGAVMLESLPDANAPGLRVSAAAGTYGFQEQRVSWLTRRSRFAAHLAWSRKRAHGDHTYEANSFGEQKIRRRANADFDQQNTLAAFDYEHDDVSARFTVLHYRGERGVPGTVLQGNEGTAAARQRELDWHGHLRLRWQAQANLSLTAWIKFRQNELHYRDPQLRLQPEGVNDYYHNRDFMAGATINRLARIGLLQFEVEAGQAHLRGDNLAQPQGDTFVRVDQVRRDHGSVLLKWEQASQPENHRPNVQAALRYSRYSDVGSALSPSLGMNWQPWQPALRFRLHAAHSFRAPTFAEQYYLNYGNQLVLPEQGWSADVGASLQASFMGRWLIDLTLYVNRVQDQIIAIPLSPVRWSTQNLGTTRNCGAELVAEWQTWHGRLTIHATYTRQNPRDRTADSATYDKLVIYVPQEIATAVAALSWPRFEGMNVRSALSARHVSFRYHLPENDYDSLMPGYTVLDANATIAVMRGEVTWQLRTEVENLANTRYEVIKNYPMPFRLWRFGLEVSW